MPKDFNDANKSIKVMIRGTDDSHIFKPELPNGSTFVWDQYTVVCEGRLAIASQVKNFDFTVSPLVIDGELMLNISFPKEIITTGIRESQVYWKVMATHISDSKVTCIKYGELWLK